MSLSSFLSSVQNHLSLGVHWLLRNAPKTIQVVGGVAQEAASLAPLAVQIETAIPGAQTAVVPTLAAAGALSAIAKAAADLHAQGALPTDPNGSTTISVSNQTILDALAILPAAANAAQAITGQPLPPAVTNAAAAAAVLNASQGGTASPAVLGGPGPSPIPGK